jgi:enhancing lycopene biosynthesis protein 2
MNQPTKRIAVILSGCGVYDGSEIHEAVSILIALDQLGATVVCCAPDTLQMHVMDHLAGKPVDGHRRNVLVESARIARGKIVDLKRLRPSDVDGAVLPGGFGAAKNLSDYALRGADCTVNPDVERFLLELQSAGKPIGLACIAPVIAGRIFGSRGLKPKLSIGTDSGTAANLHKMGAVHENTGQTQVCVDEKLMLAPTPCYMNDVGPAVVFEGARKLCEAVMRMA